MASRNQSTEINGVTSYKRKNENAIEEAMAELNICNKRTKKSTTLDRVIAKRRQHLRMTTNAKCQPYVKKDIKRLQIKFLIQKTAPFNFSQEESEKRTLDIFYGPPRKIFNENAESNQEEDILEELFLDDK
ncbi:hypothetical protein Trydic_g13302 [Trypoxylus dichotomus]